MQKANKHTKEELLKTLFSSFCTGIRAFRSTKAREWLKEHGLNHEEIIVGFNSGQFHHRKSDEFKEDYLRIGVLTLSDAPVKARHMVAHACFGSFGIVFPLKNQVGQIVNLYAIRIKKATDNIEYLNEDGLYPSYPHTLTKRLFITKDVISGATVLQSKILENRDAVLSLRDGEFQRQHFDAINQLEHLEEIILIN